MKFNIIILRLCSIRILFRKKSIYCIMRNTITLNNANILLTPKETYGLSGLGMADIWLHLKFTESHYQKALYYKNLYTNV